MLRERKEEYPEIRRELADQGMELTDEEWAKQLWYARRKAECAGKDESYIPYLLPDVVKEFFIRSAQNLICKARMSGLRINI